MKNILKTLLIISISIILPAVPIIAAQDSNSLTANVPSKHNVRVEVENATIVCIDDEESYDEEGISDIFAVDRFSEPKFEITPQKGYEIKQVLLDGVDVTEQLENGVIQLSSVYKDVSLSVITEKKSDSGKVDEKETTTKTGEEEVTTKVTEEETTIKDEEGNTSEKNNNKKDNSIKDKTNTEVSKTPVKTGDISTAQKYVLIMVTMMVVVVGIVLVLKKRKA